MTNEPKKTDKNLEATLTFTGTLDKAKIHEAVSFNIKAMAGLICISLISAFTGCLLPCLGSFPISIGLSIIGSGIGYVGIKKIREIERYMDVR